MCQRILMTTAALIAVTAVLGGMISAPPTTTPTATPTATPQIDRTAPGRIQVTGASYAYTVPESELVEGSDVLYNLGWIADGDTIAFRIDPMTVYTVHTFETGSASTEDHAEQLIVPDRESVIDHIIEQRIVWEHAMNALLDGTHPGIDQPVDYFEIRASIVRVHAQMQGGTP